MGSLLQNTVFGITNKSNTFIGGVSATINTAASLAARLGISSSRIKAFKISGPDISCEITGGNYEIAANAFFGLSVMTYYNDRKGLVTNIYNNAFYNCSSVTSYIFPELTTIQSLATNVAGGTFGNNTALVNFSAPKLTSITGGNLTTAGFCFQSNANLTTLYAPLLTGSLSSGTFYLCSKLSTLTIGKITGLGKNVFDSCSLFTGVGLDLTECTYFGDQAFRYCYSYAEINAPMLTTCGTSPANNGVFENIKTNINIKVSPYLKTVNAGAPDGDLTYAAETRNATIIYANNIIAGAYASFYQRSVNDGLSFSNGSLSTSTRGISISETTKYITIATNSNVMLSSDFGQTFIAAPLPSAVYYCASMSQDGKYQLVTQSSGDTYKSIDYGSTWQLAVTGGRRDCFVSRTGQYQLTTNIDAANITRSTNYGANWSTITGLGIISAVCCSDDGQYITAVGLGNTIKVSADGGLTWTSKAALGNFTTPKAAMSFDGKYQTVIGSNKFIHISSDYGATWTVNTNTLNNVYYTCLDISKDGKTQVTAVSTGYIYVSSDYGSTWNQKGDILNYQAIAISG